MPLSSSDQQAPHSHRVRLQLLGADTLPSNTASFPAAFPDLCLHFPGEITVMKLNAGGPAT